MPTFSNARLISATAPCLWAKASRLNSPCCDMCSYHLLNILNSLLQSTAQRHCKNGTFLAVEDRSLFLCSLLFISTLNLASKFCDDSNLTFLASHTVSPPATPNLSVHSAYCSPSRTDIARRSKLSIGQPVIYA